jgi:hypothetical protein
VGGESGLHGQPITVEIAAEAAQFRRTGGLDIGNPLIELGPASFADKDHGPAAVLPGCRRSPTWLLAEPAGALRPVRGGTRNQAPLRGGLEMLEAEPMATASSIPHSMRSRALYQSAEPQPA